ncbi:serine hydrolase domain-containing protein [Pseudotenacibaculum sp. MALMAid0570]|uniref:serine hydrolase domain-containing protein n=1 Tax=Pseudotenacibaculum sp. MALMAid0570 TaxID=3143938 RepID=UPI0032DEF7F1
MRKLILLILLTSFTGYSQSKNLDEKLDSLLANYVNANKPGLAAGVIKDGKVVYLKGFGLEDIETKKPITIQTKFQVDDLAKQFTVLAILLLEQEGKLSLEDDVRKYLPSLPEYSFTLKVKHLLNHTSGLHTLHPLKELLNIRSTDVFTHEDAINIISSQKKLNFKPGTQFSYHTSDTEVLLMVEIVKSISKQTFQEFTKKQLFEPMEMKNTSFNNSRNILSNLAKSYSIDEKTNYNPVNDLTLGVSNLYTTVEDFAKWFQLYYTNKKLSDLVKKLDAYVTLDSGKEFASTWGKLTLGRYFDHPERGLPKMSWQYGLVAGYGANVFRYQSHDVVSFVLGNNNRYNGMPAGLLGNHMMEKEFTEPAEIEYSEIDFKTLSKRDLKNFEGVYWDKTNSLVREIYVKNDTLRYKRLESNRETALLALGNNKFQFYLRGDTEVFITFTKNTFEVSSLGSDVSVYNKVDLVDPNTLHLSDYVGHYYNKELDVIVKFSLKESVLTVSNLKTETIRFYPIVKDAFRSNTYIYSGVQFTRKNNKVNGFNINTDGVKELFFERIL